MRVPFDPTAFPNGLNSYLLYELYLTNFAQTPITLNRIEVLDADVTGAPPIGSFDATQLKAMVQVYGAMKTADPKEKLTLPPGQSVVVFMSVVVNRKAPMPSKLIHRVIAADSMVQGAEISTRHNALHVLSPPVEGTDWLAADGPSNDEDNHHRRGIIVLDGRTVDSRRYAIDWKRVKNEVSFAGDSRDVTSYFSYGQAVLAVANGRVFMARDGLPNNIPGHNEAFHPAVPLTLDTVSGNTIVLDLGSGQFVYYMHLKPGSVLVRSGDFVRKGQMLARIGASGDAREPHLHFEVTTSSTLLFGEGVPYLIDHFRTQGGGGGQPVIHVNELPLGKSVVSFGDPEHE
ncbi:M23 family metallopeptidase [Granulicella paludicola]|uniref:M23 family metallopeptidase n=1 Tax=Granulicella paludicola TaxID=474951 RepID=UPI0021E0A80B|nr:M23 family metallopeptidase [Granulicella paludicola]